MITININFFSDSRTFMWPGPGASLQNMEAEVLAWAWANTLGNLVGTNVGGGGSRNMERWLWAFGHLGIWALGIWVGGIEGHISVRDVRQNDYVDGNLCQHCTYHML